MTRKIIHIDMDAFYASVEQRDNPSLRGFPIAVGQADGRGVVAAASYEARRFGVRSAMSSSKAKKLCPGPTFVNCRFDVYKSVSAQIHDIFHEYTDIIEPISLDEAFLDVTENFAGIELAVDIAKEIKRKIRERLSLVASAGVSYNKFLAKIASDYRKPDGLCVIPPERAIEFIAKMPIESFWGVGPVTAAKMHNMGIYTGQDPRNLTLGELKLHFGKAGPQYYQFARGIDNRPVEAYRERKSRRRRAHSRPRYFLGRGNRDTHIAVSCRITRTPRQSKIQRYCTHFESALQRLHADYSQRLGPAPRTRCTGPAAGCRRIDIESRHHWPTD